MKTDVVKVYGTANNLDVIFTRSHDDIWETEVPYDIAENAVWFMELFAEDAAGNVGFLCRAMFAISGHEMIIRLLTEKQKYAAILKGRKEGERQMAYVQELLVDRGEHIHIRCEIKAVCDEDIAFSVSSAVWKLLSADKLKVVAEGECGVVEHELDAFVELDVPGTYFLEYTYVIADETWVDKVRIRVG